MEHSYFKDRISAYHDQELKHEEAQMMAEHLQTCEECRKLLEELERFDRMAERHSGLADDEYWEKSARKIEAAIAPEAKSTEIIPVKSKWTGMGWKIAAVAASLALLTFIGLHEGEISDSLKEPAQAESPAVMEIAIPPDDSLSGAKADIEQETTEVVVEYAPIIDEDKHLPAPAAGDVSREDISVSKIQPTEEPDEEVDLEELAEGLADSPLPTVPKPESTELGTIEKKVKEVEAGDQLPPTQLVQSVPVEVRKGRSSEVAQDTTDSGEWYRYELADDMPVPEAPMNRMGNVLQDMEIVLEELRQERDSLENIISAGKARRSPARDRRSATSAVPMEIAPAFKGVDSVDQEKLQEAVDSVVKELERSDPVLRLLETHFAIANLTEDRREYERSVDFLKSYLDKKDSPYKLEAAWYLQRLEEAE